MALRRISYDTDCDVCRTRSLDLASFLLGLESQSWDWDEHVDRCKSNSLCQNGWRHGRMRLQRGRLHGGGEHEKGKRSGGGAVRNCEIQWVGWGCIRYVVH
jgi:hypothetical protein